MSAARAVAAGALALALLPAEGGAQAPIAAPMPAARPAAFAPAEPVPAQDAFSAAATAPQGFAPSSAPAERLPAATEGALLADPALAADLEALLGGGRQPAAVPAVSAPAAPATAPAAAAEAETEAPAAESRVAIAPTPAPPGAVAPRPVLLPGQAGQPALVWDDRPLDAAKAARLFEIACLATLPEFAGVGGFFEALGFQTVPGMRMRNHPRKNVSALATTPADVMESGVRSCAILAEGPEHAAVRSAVEPLVVARFGPAQRFETPAKGLRHVVWEIDTAAGPAKVTVTESAGSAFLGVTVLPPLQAGQQ